MRDLAAVLKRLQNIIPQGITPRFTSADALMAWHREEALKAGRVQAREYQQRHLENIFSCSGIRERYRLCSFRNYRIDNDGQKQAFTMAKSWLNKFGYGSACFVFSGSPGTGKNHLAAAIGNALLKQGKTVLIITIADLTLEVRDCYDTDASEKALIDRLCQFDLLVLDEVGVQRRTANEFVILNQIIDRRTAMMKPVGILTNLNISNLSGVLGPRVIDRLMMDGGIWVNFNWQSYRAALKRS